MKKTLIIKQLEEINSNICTARCLLEELKEEHENDVENIPENFTTRKEQGEQQVYNLEEQLEELESIESNIQDLIDNWGNE